LGEKPVKLPTAADLTQPVLKVLSALGGVASNQQIEELVAAELGLDPEEASKPHRKSAKGGRTELGYRIAWARTRLRRDGKIVNRSKGVWSLSGM